MYRRGLKIVACFSAVVVVFLLAYIAFSSASLEKAVVDRVVDGDTLIVIKNNEFEKIRLIGIDAPESVNPNREVNSSKGKQASDHLREELPKGSIVYLERDLSVQDVDKYGRLLRYVGITENIGDINNLVNLTLVKDGFAEVNFFGNKRAKYYDEFLKVAQEYERKSYELYICPWKTCIPRLFTI